MVQRKEPTKLKPKIKQVSNPHFFDLHESPVSKGTASTDNTKKKMMRYVPNYMKPTSSSDARKDQLQVTQCNSPSITGSSRSSYPKSSSPPSVNSKRKPITPFLKRNKSKVLFQKLNLNRATCSSTLKDSKFPKELDMNPGGTESDGTSVLRVCHYTYCSLNGHVHEPMPPLKCFLASKRKLIKTQQSMKLKGFSPFRKREPKRIEKEVSPLIQEVVNDFIVEIYASTKEQIVDPVKDEERTVTECQNRKREEEEAVSTVLDLKSDFSVEEMDAMVKLVEYVSCDQEIGASSQKCSDLVEEETGEENPVGTDVICTKFESFKECDVDFMEGLDVFSDSMSFSSEHTDGGSDRSHDRLFEQKAELVVNETTEETEKPIEEKSEVENVVVEETHPHVASEECFSSEHTDGGSNHSHDGLFEPKAKLDVNKTTKQTEKSIEEKFEVENARVVEMHSHVASVTESRNQMAIGSTEEGVEEDPKSNSMVDLEERGNCAESEAVPERKDEKVIEIESCDCSENEIASDYLENVSDEKSDSMKLEGGEEKLYETERADSSEIEIPTQVLENSSQEEGEGEGEGEGEEDCKTQDVEKPNSILELEEEENQQEKEIEIPGTELDHENEEQADLKQPQVLENSSQEKGEVEGEGDCKIQDVEKPNSILELEEEENHQEKEIEIPGTELDHENEEQADPKQPQVLENSSQEKGEVEGEGDCKIQDVEKPNSILELEEEENHQEKEMKEIEMPATELDHENEEQADPKHPQEDVIGTAIEDDDRLESVEEPNCMETELDPGNRKLERDQPKEEAVVTEISKIDQLCVAFGEMRIEGEDYSFDPTCQQKSRLIIARRRPMSGEDEYMRGFNPRAPNFLPIEPDPDAEKVDLRHQMMDERKNAEEYLIDYALRKVVNQLAPARKKKVELLVAAFEKVVPVTPVQGGSVTCT